MTYATDRAKYLAAAIEARRAFNADRESPKAWRDLQATELRAVSHGIPWQEIVDGAK